MSSAGHALAAMKSFQANRSLLRKKEFGRKNNLHSKTYWKTSFKLKEPSSFEEIESTRLRIKKEMEAEKRRHRLVGIFLFIVCIFSAFLLFLH